MSHSIARYCERWAPYSTNGQAKGHADFSGGRCCVHRGLQGCGLLLYQSFESPQPAACAFGNLHARQACSFGSAAFWAMSCISVMGACGCLQVCCRRKYSNLARCCQPASGHCGGMAETPQLITGSFSGHFTNFTDVPNCAQTSSLKLAG